MAELDLGRAARSSRNKNAKYIEFSDSDSESDQSNYENGEQILVPDGHSDNDSDSEDFTIAEVLNTSKKTKQNYVGRQIMKEFDGTKYLGKITGVDILTDKKNKGKRVYEVCYTDGDKEDLFEDEVEESLLPVDFVVKDNSTTDNKVSAPKAKKNTNKREFFKVTGSRVWLLLDIETTGSKRNWDIPIVWAWIVVAENGQVLEERECRVHPGNVSIKDRSKKLLIRFTASARATYKMKTNSS